MNYTEMKPDAGIVATVRKRDGAVKIESFLTGNPNVLTQEEVKEQGLPTVKPNSTEEIYIWCGGISNRFKEYSVVSTAKEITGVIKSVEKQDEKERKHTWVSILRELTRYTDEELNAHYEAHDQAWGDWCNDAVLFYAYNAVIFKKGIPCREFRAWVTIAP